MRKLRFILTLISLILLQKEIFAQSTDSLKYQVKYTNLQWLEKNYVFKIDSDINFFHAYNLQLFPQNSTEKGYFYNNIGNLGSPSYNQVYGQVSDFGFDAGIHFFDIFRLKNNDIRFYDSWSPFTRIYYVQGAKELQIFHVLHSRNITPRWNVTLLYRGYASTGFYLNQVSKNKNIALTSRYASRNGMYKIYASAIVNNLKANDNGGITNDSLFQTFKSLDKTRALVWLYSAQHGFKEMDFSLLQILNLTKKDTFPDVKRFGLDHFSLQHQINYNESTYTYTDDLATDSGYYRSIYIDSARTSDRFYEKKLVNRLQLNYNWKHHTGKDSINVKPNYFRAGLLYESGEIKQDTLQSEFNNLAAFVKTRISIIPDIDVFADLSYFLSGTQAKDFSFTEGIYAGPIRLGMQQDQKSPSFIQQHMFSNHLKWENDFKPLTSTSFFIKTPLNLNSILTGSYSRLKNYISYDSLLLPVQTADKISVFSAELFLTNKIGHFHFVNRVFYQHCSNPEIIRLPDWIFQGIYYYENRFFKDVLNLQIGIDGRFVNAYQPYSRYAAFNILYSGTEEKLPYSLILDVFINANVKRMNFFLKYENVNYGFPRDYNYLLPHYPADPRVFRFGLSWMFFD